MEAPKGPSIELQGQLPSAELDAAAPNVSAEGDSGKFGLASGIAAGAAAGAAAVGGMLKLGGKGDVKVKQLFIEASLMLWSTHVVVD